MSPVPVEGLCKHCQQGNTLHVCSQCLTDIKIMTLWCNPQGRPAENYHRGLMEWTHTGVTCHGVMSWNDVKSRQITDPWTVLKRHDAIPKEKEFGTDMGCYPGYLYSLLLCLIFQLKKDVPFLRTMKVSECRADQILKEKGMVHPFNIDLVRKLFEFEDGFEDMLKGINITFDERVNKASETFCGAVADAFKGRGASMIDKKRRICKYSGTVWTRKFVENNVPKSCLESFEKFLKNNQGSQINDCFSQFTSPPTAKKRKKKGGGETNGQQSSDIGRVDALNAAIYDSPAGDCALRYSTNGGTIASDGHFVGSLCSPTFHTPRHHIKKRGAVDDSPSRPFDSPVASGMIRRVSIESPTAYSRI